MFLVNIPKLDNTDCLKNLFLELDLVGSAAFVPAVICFLLAVQWGGSKYPWDSPCIIVLFVLGSILVIAFMVIECWQQDRATIPPRLIKNRNVLGAFSFCMCLTGAFFIFSYYVRTLSIVRTHF